MLRKPRKHIFPSEANLRYEQARLDKIRKPIQSGLTWNEIDFIATSVIHPNTIRRNRNLITGIEQRFIRAIIIKPGSLTGSQWEQIKEKQNHRCLCCGMKEPEIKLTMDHVKPVSKGGEHSAKNIQGLCKSCNSRKHTKEIDYRS